MAEDRKNIDEIDRTILFSNYQDTERIPGRDSSGDFKFTPPLKEMYDRGNDNESDIADNASDIADNTSDIADIEDGTTAITPPIGYYYWQPAEDDGTFTSANEPGTLLGGTWSRLWNDGDGEFPKAEGATATGQTRTDGLQPDQLQGHYHDIYTGANQSGRWSDDSLTGTMGDDAGGTLLQPAYATNIITDGTNGTPRTGTVTEPTNREFKLWKRTA